MTMFSWSFIVAALLSCALTVSAGDFRDLLEKHTFAAGEEKLPYRLLKPEKTETGKKYPLVVFLHGAGERGDDNARQLLHGVAEFAKPENRSKYPCYLIAPQCPTGKSWAGLSRKETATPKEPQAPLRMTIDLITSLKKQFPIDEKRVYITGLSMGGYGTWDALARFPDLFAAAAPICGGGNPASATQFAKIPIWAFHGGKDSVVPPERSRSMIEAIKKAGGQPKYTEYPDVAHNSWAPAYADPELFTWLFAQQKH